jgi:hypothetical protein
VEEIKVHPTDAVSYSLQQDPEFLLDPDPDPQSH